jgi:hypothetical protein
MDESSASARSEPPLSEGAARRAARMATPRLQRELRTIEAMLQIHCADHHAATSRLAGTALCDGCAALLDYAGRRLAGCPYGADKPTCTNCRIHCYGPAQREAVRQVMRHAGPRMLLRHPVLAIAHVLDGRRPAPPKPRGKPPAERG